MRRILFSLFAVVAACGGDDSSPDGGGPKDASSDSSFDAGQDASPEGDASSDAGVDASSDAGIDASSDAGIDASSDAGADAGCQPTTLLVGGTDVIRQGWSVAQQPPATITYGTDYVHLETSTPAGARSGGQLLLYRAGVVETGKPFKIQVEMMIESVTTHNQYDTAAAIMGSLTGPVGNPAERGEMIYLDSNQIGWADDTRVGSPFNVATTDRYHVYELSVDASNTAHVTVDGTAALTRANFTTNGTIAVGDQTNDPGVESKLRIRSVKKLCP
jgi:hypothetical protein